MPVLFNITLWPGDYFKVNLEMLNSLFSYIFKNILIKLYINNNFLLNTKVFYIDYRHFRKYILAK